MNGKIISWALAQLHQIHSGFATKKPTELPHSLPRSQLGEILAGLGILHTPYTQYVPEVLNHTYTYTFIFSILSASICVWYSYRLVGYAANVVVTGTALFGQTQPPFAPEATLVTGGAVQCALAVHGAAEMVLVTCD